MKDIWIVCICACIFGVLGGLLAVQKMYSDKKDEIIKTLVVENADLKAKLKVTGPLVGNGHLSEKDNVVQGYTAEVKLTEPKNSTTQTPYFVFSEADPITTDKRFKGGLQGPISIQPGFHPDSAVIRIPEDVIEILKFTKGEKLRLDYNIAEKAYIISVD